MTEQGGLANDEREALVAERNHWIGEAKRYERLYRDRDADATRWWTQRNEALSALAAREQGRADLAAKVKALADEWEREADEQAQWRGRGYAERLRAVLAADTTPRGDQP